MYATRQDMIDRYGTPRLVQLTDVNSPLTGAIVDAVLETKLVDASAEIDGYLVGRYALPLATVPAILRTICCDLALVRLMGDNAGDNERADVKRHMDYLRGVAKGDILITAPADVPDQAGLGSVLFEPGQKVMGRESEYLACDPYRGRW